MPSVRSVEVSVITGHSRVSFDLTQTGETVIADKITASGHTARVNYVLSTQENRALREDENSLAGNFIARIGTRLIAREDFQTAIEMQRIRSGGQGSEHSAMRSSWERLMQREVLLATAEKSGIVVQGGEIQAEMARMNAAMIEEGPGGACRG